MVETLLAVDFGTSNTVAVLHRADRVDQLIFDGSPLLPSAVCWAPASGLLVGRDAERAAAAAPERFESNPKRRIDDGTVWLGDREVDVAEAIAAVLGRVADEATRTAGARPDRTVLTHPAVWAGPRRDVLADAAGRAGLSTVEFTPEPVAAAAYFTHVLGHRVAAGRCVVVYDLGGGTFDVAVVAPTASHFTVLAADGLADVGGLDLDALIVAHVRAATTDHPAADAAWGRMDWPQSAADRRHRRLLWQDARAAKEQLSRLPSAGLTVPLVERDHLVTREEFDRLAAPVLERTVALTMDTLRAARIGPESVAGLFLVGGSSRVPLVASMLHRTLRIAPTVIEQPETVVAEGAARAVGPQPAVQPQPAPQPAPAFHPAVRPQPTVRPRPEPPVPPAPQPVAPSEPVPPVDSAPAPATVPVLLRVVGWLAIGIGLLVGVGRLTLLYDVAVFSDELGARSLAPTIARTCSDMLILVLSGVLMQRPGRRAWIGGGLLAAAGVLALRYAPQTEEMLKSWWWWQTYFGLTAFGNWSTVVLAAATVVGLWRMRPPPEYPRPPAKVVATAIAVAAVGSAAYARINFLTYGSDLSISWQFTWLAVAAVAVVAYAARGRPVAAAPGVLLAAVLAVVPVGFNLVDNTGYEAQSPMRVAMAVTTGAYLLAAAIVADALRD